MDKYWNLRKMVEELEQDFAKFYEKGNKAAGTRIRKSMQDIKGLTQVIRTAVQNTKNGG